MYQKGHIDEEKQSAASRAHCREEKFMLAKGNATMNKIRKVWLSPCISTVIKEYMQRELEGQ